MNRLLDEPRVAAFVGVLGAGAVKRVASAVLDRARSATSSGSFVPEIAALAGEIADELEALERAGLVDVFNGVGILLHTNLGRAPLAPSALAAMARISGGYSNLEFDLDSGARGSRYERLTVLLRDTTGAEDALVVNNCAAAILLILDTFANGREVVVARNQLIEIGGGFRLPDVLLRSGARLVEVGATNKVYARDFERALTADTALLMRSHTSNYAISGFTHDVSAAELAAVGRRTGVPTVEDLGSGALVDLTAYGLPREPTVGEIVAAGIDLVAFSGDKLLGGPQAGIIVGRRAAIARMRANPLLRALRVDKGTIAALAETLRLYLVPGGVGAIPLYAMLAASAAGLRARAERLMAQLDDLPLAIDVVATEGQMGGGTLPLATIASVALRLSARDGGDPNALAQRLRGARPPVIGKISGRGVLLDLRTIAPDRDGDLVRTIRSRFGA